MAWNSDDCIGIKKSELLTITPADSDSCGLGPSLESVLYELIDSFTKSSELTLKDILFSLFPNVVKTYFFTWSLSPFSTSATYAKMKL